MNRICKGCRSGNVQMFYSQGPLPVLQNRSYTSSQEARQAPCGNVDLALCLDCGLIYNASFRGDLVVYDTEYNNNQSLSPIFHEHLLDVIRLLKRKGALDKRIVEIGCGKGDFFKLLKQQGYQVTGFDPAYEGQDKDVIKDYFSEKYAAECVANFIILRHVVEHIEQPFDFLSSIAKANHYQGGVYIEVPSFEWIVEHKAFWDIFPEHCNYFTADFWGSVFSEYEHGLIFEGQYQYIIADWKSLRKVPRAPAKVAVPDLNGLRSFIQTYGDFVQQRKDVFVWGAGAKGMTFVNLVDSHHQHISALVDINAKKQGRYVGRTAHPIIGPQEMANKVVGEVVIMNGIYENEIRNSLEASHAHFHVMGEGH